MASPEIVRRAKERRNPEEQLHVRDGWRKGGLGSCPESQDEPGKN